jgi:radical SAM superfamily enzyme YgiQ (UPF0313 family)
MSDIVLATLNARFIHCAFGLRYLLANMGELQDRTVLLEFTTQQPTLEILDTILEQQPKIVGLGIYIWNVDETTRLVADLKRIRPDIVVVLGGPEVSYEADDQPIVTLADHVISGEADLAFAQFCREQLANLGSSKATFETLNLRSITSNLPALHELVLPYDLYTDDDLAHRVIYVEASRGCPFSCEFCLSALDIPVRQFPLEKFLGGMESLLSRGARQFKFVDRTFNLNLRVGREILEFFLDRYQPGLFLHFEMIPDRLPDALKDLIVRFPAGSLQFEVGIQTFNETVCELISRHQDNDVAEENLRWLRDNTGVHVHADLIVGLPGETLESFADGFDRLVKLRPNEIQVGILKRLRGTPIIRHDTEWGMIYSPHPPYEILLNKLLNFSAIQEMRRFAKYWDAIANSGNFVESIRSLWEPVSHECFPVGISHVVRSPFHEFRRLAAWIFAQERKSHGIPLGRLIELLFTYLITVKGLSPSDVATTLWRDYQRGGRNDKPHCLRPFIDAAVPNVQKLTPSVDGAPKRQARHWVG